MSLNLSVPISVTIKQETLAELTEILNGQKRSQAVQIALENYIQQKKLEKETKGNIAHLMKNKKFNKVGSNLNIKEELKNYEEDFIRR